MKRRTEIVLNIAVAVGLIIASVLFCSANYERGYRNGYIKGKADAKPKEIVKILQVEPTPQPEFESLGMFETTAYCHCVKCCGKDNGITASGTKATAGRTIAADTGLFPFGTELYINGNKYIVEDRGGGIKGNRIDIYFSTHQEALQYGRKMVEVLKKTLK